MSEQLQNPEVAVASQPFQMPDWGIGRYERFAPDLEPAAEHVVELAELHPGECVLDLGCGTGNAALLAARAGAAVTGIDPASRLLEIARERLAADGLDGSFVVGDAQALPFRDGEFDAVLSVFGVIFAVDAERALSEAIRVLKPTGRMLISVWLPGGGVDPMTEVLVKAIGAAHREGASAVPVARSRRSRTARRKVRRGRPRPRGRSRLRAEHAGGLPPRPGNPSSDDDRGARAASARGHL